MHKYERGLLPWILQETINPLLILIITNHTDTSFLLSFSNMWLNTLLGTLLTLYNTGKFKQSHDLVVGK